ncbi:MAG TPA: A/G-specific adenine glycosylase [Terriglobales bacterium]|jgi:A/G-specific adenine glycosylase|nr:A/G-specific adenine glycosylase [Terriglobales bacterium]
MIPPASRQFGGEATRRWRRRLLAWYDRSARDLPWRHDRDPYRVWVSEVMLQQTRVAAVLDHYRVFLERFPTVQQLAAARESAVLAAWSGLGYYRRARMLHAAAKAVVTHYNGEFPSTVVELRNLPGIGRYTAAAIASIVFNLPVAVVDGNVERVLLRAFGDSPAEKDPWALAEELLSRTRPGDFNQAMMELGATVCLPRQPRCAICPVFELCATRGDLGRPKKAARQRRREICYDLSRRDGSILLVRRSRRSPLMPGMWELPEVSGEKLPGPVSFTLRHSITVTDYVVHVTENAATGTTAGKWVKKDRIARLPLTGLARKILRRANVI